MNMKHWHIYEIIKGCQKDDRSEKNQSPNSLTFMNWSSSSNSYLTDNNILIIAEKE